MDSGTSTSITKPSKLQPPSIHLPTPPSNAATYVTKISPIDVLMGRGVDLARHHGNVEFRQLIQSRINDYIDAKRKGNKKGSFSHDIFNVIVHRNGRFLRRVKTRDEREKLQIPITETSTNVWVPVTKDVAIAKIKQAFRDCNKKVDQLIINSKTTEFATLPTTTTSTSHSKKIQMNNNSLSNKVVSKNPSSSKSVPAEDSLKSLVAQTLQRYQQQHQERRQSLDSSALLSVNETSRTVSSVPHEAININTQPTTTRTIVSSLPSQPIESALYQHQIHEHSLQLFNAPYSLHTNNYTVPLQYQNFVHNYFPLTSDQWQSRFGNYTSSIPVRQDLFETDRWLLQQQEPRLNHSRVNQNPSVNYHDTSWTLQQQLVPTLLASRSIGNQISPYTTLQQQISTLPLLNDSNIIIPRYSLHDDHIDENHNMTLQRYLMSDRQGPLVQNNLPLISDDAYLQNLPQGTVVIPSTYVIMEAGNNNPMLSQLVSERMFIPNGQAVAGLPPNDAHNATNNDCNNDDKKRLKRSINKS